MAEAIQNVCTIMIFDDVLDCFGQKAASQRRMMQQSQQLRAASLVYEQYLRFATDPDKLIGKGEAKVVCMGQEHRPSAMPATPILDKHEKHISSSH